MKHIIKISWFGLVITLLVLYVYVLRLPLGRFEFFYLIFVCTFGLLCLYYISERVVIFRRN